MGFAEFMSNKSPTLPTHPFPEVDFCRDCPPKTTDANFLGTMSMTRYNQTADIVPETCFFFFEGGILSAENEFWKWCFIVFWGTLSTEN